MERFGKKFMQEVPMIDSQATNLIKRKPNMPATLFNRSPIKQTENKSFVSNRPLTPSRKPVGSISPNKIRPDKSLRSSNIPRQSAAKQLHCRNHENKVAQFLVMMEDEKFYYCQKCSILVASQGFNLTKLNGYQQESNPLQIFQDQQRRAEIESFLFKLDETKKKMDRVIGDVSSKLTLTENNLTQKIEQVESYYQHLIYSIEQHKAETIELLTQHALESQTQIKSANQMLSECNKDSSAMRTDILTSIEIIKDAEQVDFRPVMDSYYVKLQNFEQCIQEAKTCKVTEMVLAFNNIEQITKQTLQSIQIGFEQIENHQSQRSSNPYFSFDTEQGQPFAKPQSSFFPQKPSTAVDEKTLRSSNLSRQKIGYSMNQL